MKNHVIFKIRAGSHLYGLNTENSDLDYIGVYLNTKEEILGLNSSEIIDDSIVSKHEDSNKNTKDATDCTYYELRRFCKLALNANPTILETLFVNPENIVVMTAYGSQLLKNRDLFLSQKIKHSYMGYAFSQKRKSQIKTENLKILFVAREELLKADRSMMFYDYINGGTTCRKFVKFDDSYPDYATIADLRFNNQKIGDVLAKINNRIDKASHRSDGMLEHGLDYKFISHTLRLLSFGRELITTGHLNLPCTEHELLMNVKLGKLKPIEVMEIIEEREAEMDAIYKAHSSVLHHKPNFNAVNDLVINIYSNYLNV